ncbi:hypothetical protein Nepgr_021179 [Nepenthes gracilis]|uniref:BTB domain-containing protein n=1 Tax=Nepenthes gracilis TaxID=150966 RepID=A0AAD3SWE6_NEPGR|nr:hypothetical protein Nepgr_021179 [Nepenthes gracilis]
MDCSICSNMPFILRPPRNTICAACFEGARSVIALINKFDADKFSPEKSSNAPSSSKGLANVVKWVKEMKEMEEELNDKISFLGRLEAAFRDQIHTDIQVKPGNDGPPIPAHRLVLASKSEIFRNMLDSDGCKAAPKDTITLPELGHEELGSLLEFLYSGSLPMEKVERHVYSLSIAADKYEIPFLQKFCEHQMLGSLSTSNALDVLDIADVCSNQTLKDTALNYIVKNMEDIVFTPKFEAFALKTPHLSVEITRASWIDIKNRRS